MKRRTVVSSYRSMSNYFTCTLSCGHVVTAYGRTAARGQVQTAPRTVACRQCTTNGVPPSSQKTKPLSDTDGDVVERGEG